MADGFFTGQNTQPTVSKYWRRKLQRKTTQKKHKENTKYTYGYTHKIVDNTAYKYNTASPLVYNNIGWLGDSSHRAGSLGLNDSGAAAVVPLWQLEDGYGFTAF